MNLAVREPSDGEYQDAIKTKNLYITSKKRTVCYDVLVLGAASERSDGGGPKKDSAAVPSTREITLTFPKPVVPKALCKHWDFLVVCASRPPKLYRAM
eukprot:3048650-Amphidinium_carterae.1